jgi:hypothetical protein
LKVRVLFVLLVLMTVSGSSTLAQLPGRTISPPSVTAQVATQNPEVAAACSVRRTCIVNPVFALGMKCDGVTDDSAALQAALNSAQFPGLGSASIIMPPGICIIDPAANVSINSSVWLQGAGRFGTTLRRKNSSGSGLGSLLRIQSDGITLSDFAIDGNKGGPGIASSIDSLAANGPFRQITIQRMRFLNATSSDIVSTITGTGNFTADWLVADSDFDNQGNLDCNLAIACANIHLTAVLRARIFGNRSDKSQNFVLTTSVPGGGQLEVGQNIVTNIDGFGVVTGGGVIGAAGVHIHDNFISTTTTNPFNLIDLGFWSDFTVDHNVLYHNGGLLATPLIPTACIADFPPAEHGEVDSNVCYCLPSPSNVGGILLGGSDVSITNNYVVGAGTAGIGYTVSNAAPERGVRIIGNTVKNNSQEVPGAHGGIELFLDPGGVAAMSDVIVRGNHSYDDQASKTQAWGITIAAYGQKTGFSNVLIEGNNVTGNKVAGILNSASAPFSGFVIRNNAGYNPIGGITAPAFPASATALINDTGYDATVYITSGTNPISIAIGDTPVAGLFIPGGGALSGPIRLPANQTITLTYMPGGTPTWQWIAD